MKFPKDRSGWSGQGRTDARFLDDSGPPDQEQWLRKRRGNVEARVRGGFLESRVDEPEVTQALYVSLGRVPGSGMEAHLSATGAGVYGRRKSFNIQGVELAGQGALMVPLGDGSILNFMSSPIRRVRTDKDNILVTEYDMYTVRTKDFKNATLVATSTTVEAAATTLGDALGSSGVLTALRGVRFAGGYESAHLFVGMDEDKEFCVYFCKTRGVTSTTTKIARNRGLRPLIAGFYNPVPGVYFAIIGEAVPYLASTNEQAALTLSRLKTAKPPYLILSTDGGQTWLAKEDTPALERTRARLLAIRDAPNVSSFSAATWNDAINGFTVAESFLNPSFSVLVLSNAADAGEGAQARVNTLAVLNHLTGDFVRTTRLGGTGDTVSYAGGTMPMPRQYLQAQTPLVPFPAPGGGVLLTLFEGTSYFRETTFGAWSDPPPLYFTDDGVNLRRVGTAPRPGYMLGAPRTVRKDTLWWPAYDDGAEKGFKLYESKDMGATWKVRGRIATDGQVPTPPQVAPTAYCPLDAFGQVIQLLDEFGNPTNPTPATPWASDDRKKP